MVSFSFGAVFPLRRFELFENGFAFPVASKSLPLLRLARFSEFLSTRLAALLVIRSLFDLLPHGSASEVFALSNILMKSIFARIVLS
jgi:hypothetical protein